jgi:hypothetical protein
MHHSLCENGCNVLKRRYLPCYLPTNRLSCKRNLSGLDFGLAAVRPAACLPSCPAMYNCVLSQGATGRANVNIPLVAAYASTCELIFSDFTQWGKYCRSGLQQVLGNSRFNCAPLQLPSGSQHETKLGLCGVPIRIAIRLCGPCQRCLCISTKQL